MCSIVIFNRFEQWFFKVQRVWNTGRPEQNWVPIRLAVPKTTSHTLSPSWTARGRRHSGRTHNTDELLRLLFKDTLPPSNRQPSLPALPDMCELLQKSREWLVTADCLWYQRVDTETALKHCCYGGGSNFCCKMEQYLINVLAGIDYFALNCSPNSSDTGGWC